MTTCLVGEPAPVEAGDVTQINSGPGTGEVTTHRPGEIAPVPGAGRAPTLYVRYNPEPAGVLLLQAIAGGRGYNNELNHTFRLLRTGLLLPGMAPFFTALNDVTPYKRTSTARAPVAFGRGCLRPVYGDRVPTPGEAACVH